MSGSIDGDYRLRATHSLSLSDPHQVSNPLPSRSDPPSRGGERGLPVETSTPLHPPLYLCGGVAEVWYRIVAGTGGRGTRTEFPDEIVEGDGVVEGGSPYVA